MRVFNITASISRLGGGLSESVLHFSLETHAQGIPIEIAALHDVFSDEDQSKWLPLKTHAFPVVGPLQFGYSPDLNRYLDTSSPDLLHLHGIWKYPGIATLRYARNSGKPYIVSPHGMLERWSLQQSRIRKIVAGWLYQNACLSEASCLHVTSELEFESIRRFGLKNPVALIPNGITLPNNLSFSKSLNPKRRKRALFLSRIHPKKGLLNLVTAWNELFGKNLTPSVQSSTLPALDSQLNEWELVLIGPDEKGHLAEVMALVQKLGLQNQIRYGGEIWDDEAKWRCYQEADLFVLPSYSENFGLVIAEALGCGVPVITTRETPWRELELHQCGWWIDTGIPPLIDTLRMATISPFDQLREMGQRGRQLIQQKYSWAPIGRQMTEVYEWITEKRRKPLCVVED